MDLNVDTSVNTDRSRIDDREPDTEDRAPARDRGPVSVRESLKRSFEDARRDEVAEPAEEEQEEVEGTTEGDEVEAAPAEGEAEETERAVAPTAKTKADTAPAAWSKDAKAEWASVPDKVKAAIIKREKDVEKGVESLKAQYAEIDQAVAPYANTIKQFQKTPGQAVAQLFAWFDALAKDPDQAFPALIQSYRYDPRRLFAAYGIDVNQLQQVLQNQQQQSPQNQQQTNGQVQPEVDIPPAVQSYINKLEERLNGFQSQVGQTFNGLAQSFAEQQQAKTHEMLEQWASDKPHFDQVRVMMGHLLTPDPNTGQAAIPLKNGRVDLDAAYEAAVYANPEIRMQIMQDQQAQAEAARQAKIAADAKAQADKVQKARRASGSVTSSAPGAEISRKGTPSRGLSVRDSLKAAISELSDR